MWWGGTTPLTITADPFVDPITADKTFAEILEAYNGCRPIYINHLPVIGIMTNEADGEIYQVDLTTLTANSYDPLYFDTYSVADDNSWTYTSRRVDAQ